MSKQLNAQAETLISTATQQLLINQPFFGVVLCNLKVEPIDSASWPADQVETMATDGKRLIYGAAYVVALTAKKRVGLLAHEVYHIALRHHTRRGDRDPRLWNVACDYAVDQELTSMGFDVPDPLIDARFRGLAAEAIYAILKRENCQQKPKAGGIIDAAPPTEPGKLAEAEAATERLIRQAVMATRASGPGAPGAIVRMVDALNKPKVSWREHFWDFAGSSERSDYSWAKPNRRHLGRGLILPSLRPLPAREIVGAIDTSGSMDRDAVAAGVTEFQAMLDEGAVDSLWLVYCDSAIQGFERYETGDIIKPEIPGGGCTAFSPVWPWVRENAPDASRIVYFTDMGSSDFGSPPDIPVLWARYGSTKEAPFGEHLDIDANG
jgi:predicted metal-dependent peptidase